MVTVSPTREFIIHPNQWIQLGIPFICMSSWRLVSVVKHYEIYLMIWWTWNISGGGVTLIPVSFSDTIGLRIEGIMNRNPSTSDSGNAVKYSYWGLWYIWDLPYATNMAKREGRAISMEVVIYWRLRMIRFFHKTSHNWRRVFNSQAVSILFRWKQTPLNLW